MASVTQALPDALARVREQLLDPDALVRAVAAGRQKGRDRPRWRRAELRYVDLRAGRCLQLTTYDETRAYTANHTAGEEAARAVDALLADPFGNWHVETTTHTHQLRVTKKGRAVVHTATREDSTGDGEDPGSAPGAAAGPDRSHDRSKPRLLPPEDPLLAELGLATADGQVKPSRQAKYRQVEQFLRELDAALTDALDAGHVRHPTSDDPLRVVDLGCGNAYLTLAALRYLGAVRGLPVTLTGVDVKEQSREHNERVAAAVGMDATFVVGGIGDAPLDRDPDVVLALHACDTATDEALARAVGAGAALVLAAPCCHHDVAAQLRETATPSPYAPLTRHGILRERFADTLTDALRASLLRLQGYTVSVVEFVASRHTPRNTLIRAVRTGQPVPGGRVRREYEELVATWGVRPRLAVLLGETGAAPRAGTGDGPAGGG